MAKSKVFVTRVIPAKGLDLIRDFCDADIWSGELPPPQAEMIQRVRDVEGIVSMLTDKIQAALMDAAPRLKVISNFAVGFDNIDAPEATRRKIPVGNTPGVLTDATADQTFALLLASARHVVAGEKYVRSGKWMTWGPQLLLGADLAGATLGIIGFGRIGRAVAKRAQGFDLRVIYYGPTAEPAFGASPVDLDTLLRESDFVSLHVPLTSSTRRLVNAEFLSKMKSTAILVNTARGGVVDQSALYAALKSKRILAAALDVTDPEPLPVDHPLLELENCLIVPHLGSASHHTRDRMSDLAAQNLMAGLRGERLPNCVNPEVYGK